MGLHDANLVAGCAFWICLALVGWDAWEWAQQRAAARERAALEKLRQERRLVDFVGRARGRGQR